MLIPAGLLVAGAQTGTAFDFKTCRKGLLLLSVVTAGADTCGTMSLQTSDDNATFAAVAPAVTIANIAAGAAGVIVEYDIPALKRYCRFLYTGAVAAASYIAVSLVAFDPVHMPAT